MSERHTIGGEGPNDFGSEVAREDWRRYGGARGEAGTGGDRPGSTGRETDEQGRLRDDLYLDYRREGNGSGPRRTPEQDAAARRRRLSNLIGVAVAIAVIGTAAVVLNIQATTYKPASSPSRVALLSPGGSGLALPSGSSLPSTLTRVAHVGVTIKTPLLITIPDRGLDPDDGYTMYLTGNSGGFAMDPGTGRVLRVYGGPPFVSGMKRAVVDQALWLSTWPGQGVICGQECWKSATTYRVDLANGTVLETYLNTYLVGATSDGLWLATGSNVERHDPQTGAIAASTPWQGTAEPRVGCDYLWSYDQTAKETSLNYIDPSTGNSIRGSTLSTAYTFGPIWSDGQCWLMSGTGGSSNRTTSLAWLNADGSTYMERQIAQSLVVLDREFWVYTADGTIQRFEPSAEVPYGVKYTLPIRPSDGDPRWFFASSGTLWLTLGDQLIGFDARTGASAVRG